MLKFRALKEKIVCSKRHSQKLSEEELLSLTEQHSLSRLNFSLSSKLHAQIHQITDDHYKIAHRRTSSECNAEGDRQRVRTECVQSGEREEARANCLDFQQTAKKGSHLSKSVIEGSNFNKIVELLREVIELKKLRLECPKQSSVLGAEMREKLGVVRVLLRSLEDDSQKSLIDFYNEECEEAGSPHSYSQNSDETYQPQTDREAYELSERKDTSSTDDHEEPVEIKYRRLSPSDYREQSIFEMFCEEEGEGERDLSPECDTFEERPSDRAIVHLFSYGKESGLDSPLSRITEREEEYFSPESKQPSLTASLEYKKIYYLLETSGKKEEQTYRREVSEFTPRESSLSHNESKDRSRCHEQLGEMISLLENKYHRKVKIGVENLMDSLNLAIKDKSIRLRKK